MHDGVDSALQEYKDLINNPKLMQNEIYSKAWSSIANSLLKNIMHDQFLGMLYLLEKLLANLTAPSKTFETGSLSFLRTSSAISSRDANQKSLKYWNLIESLRNFGECKKFLKNC